MNRNSENFNLRRVNSELENEKNQKINNIEVTSVLKNVLFTSSNNCKNENAVLIRITNPNNANWVLYRKWKEELEENNFDVWFLIIGEGESILENTIVISSKEILTTYQYLEDLPYQVCGFPSQEDLRIPMYHKASHIEGNVLWYKKIGGCYSNVWILDETYVYSGNIGSYLSSYKDNNSDFITELLDISLELNFRKNCKTKMYEEYENLHQRGSSLIYRSPEKIQRWSSRMFSTFSLQLNDGLHAISELYVAETVIYNKFTYSLL